MQNQKIIITEFGGPEVLTLVNEALPEPDKGEIRVKVLAAGTGFTDTVIREGQYVDNKEKPPFVPGYDWFGIVDKIAPDVTDYKVGDYVADLSVIGGYCQYLCVAADKVIPAPAGLDPAEAVAMVLSYGTAYQMLSREVNLKPGDTALIHAAGGAVGSAICELAQLLQVKLIGTASKPKHSLLAHFNCAAIDYKNEDFVERTLALTDGKGVDAVFDTIGGANWSRSYRCLKRGGKLIGFGAYQLTSGEEKLPSLLWGFFKLLVLWKCLPNGKDSGFYNIQTRRAKKPKEFNADMAQLFEWLKQGKLKPSIAERRPLKDAIAVHKQLDNGEIMGKTVLLPTL